jgi:hypothetical protein
VSLIGDTLCYYKHISASFDILNPRISLAFVDSMIWQPIKAQ